MLVQFKMKKKKNQQPMTRHKVRLNLEKYLQPMIEKEIQAVI